MPRGCVTATLLLAGTPLSLLLLSAGAGTRSSGNLCRHRLLGGIFVNALFFARHGTLSLYY